MTFNDDIYIYKLYIYNYKFEFLCLFQEMALYTIILNILNPFRNHRITISSEYRPIRGTITR